MDFPDYLTDEQKRFWSPENWGNLRIFDQKEEIEHVSFDLEYSKSRYPVHMIYRNIRGDIELLQCETDGCNEEGSTRVSEVRPKKTVAWGKEDFIKHRNCLFFDIDSPNEIVNCIFMIDINNDRIKLAGNWKWLSCEHVAQQLKYSTNDGITWLPCTKEVEQ